MDINLSLSAAPSITSNYIVVAIYNTTAPSTVVASQSFAAPHTAPQNVSFTGVPAGTYYVYVYSSPTTSPGGVTEFQFLYDPTWGTATVKVDLVLIGGVSSGFTPGANSYTDNSLVGWTYSIERRGIGTLIEGTDYSLQSNGFTLLATGDVIGSDEIFILHFQPQITSVTPVDSLQGGVIFGGGETLTADTTLTASDMGNVLNIAASTAIVLNITLPASSAVTNFKMTPIVSEGGTHIVANIIPSGSDQIKWLGDTWSNSDPFAVCQGESFTIYFDGNYWRIINAVGNWDKIGEFVFTDTRGSANILNKLQLDGSATYLRTSYPRLWRWINTRLDSSLLVTDTAWQQYLTTDTGDARYPNTGRYSTGDGSTTFRLPMLHNVFDSNNYLQSGGFLRIADGNANIAGVLHKDKVGNFIAKPQLIDISPAGGGNPAKTITVFRADPAYNGNSDSNLSVFTKGCNPFDSSVNNETAPFARNVYCFIRF